MPEHKSYYEQVKSAIGEFKAAAADGKFTVIEVAGLGVSIVETGIHVLRAAQSPQEHLEELIRDCEKLFDEFVPTDVPVVPNWVEPLLKAQIRGGIRPALTAAIDYLKAA